MKRPFPAYKGDAPYLFVCYAHADAAVVYPEIDWLRNQGFNIWYDEGISAGADWRDEIARNIDGAAVFLYFLSPASVASGDCVRELGYAVDQDKPMVISELAATELRGGLKLAIASIQNIRRHELSSEVYRDRVLDALRRYLTHSIRTITEQMIVFSDLRQFGPFMRTAPTEAVEDLLVRYENIVVGVCHRFDGIVRSIDGDSCLLTFADPHAGIAAVRELASQWLDYVAACEHSVHIAMGITIGDFRLFRSFSFGTSLMVAFALCTLAKSLGDAKTTALLSERIVERLGDESMCAEVDPSSYFKRDTAESRGNAIVYADFLKRHRTFELRLD